MPTEVEPIVDNWYCHMDKGQRFRVVAIDKAARTVEMQDFEGTLIEYDFDTWYQEDLEVCEAPLSWAGAEDVGNIDDYGTEVTDTKSSDWTEPADDFEPKSPLSLVGDEDIRNVVDYDSEVTDTQESDGTESEDDFTPKSPHRQ